MDYMSLFLTVFIPSLIGSLIVSAIMTRHYNKQQLKYPPGSGKLFLFQADSPYMKRKVVADFKNEHSFTFFRYLGVTREHHPFPPFKDKFHYRIEYWN